MIKAVTHEDMLEAAGGWLADDPNTRVREVVERHDELINATFAPVVGYLKELAGKYPDTADEIDDILACTVQAVGTLITLLEDASAATD